MKNDSTKKSVARDKEETKNSETKGLKKEIDTEEKNENQIIPEKDTNKYIDNLKLEEYPNYLDKLLKQSDWITYNDVFNLLKNTFENKLLDESLSEIFNIKKIENFILEIS